MALVLDFQQSIFQCQYRLFLMSPLLLRSFGEHVFGVTIGYSLGLKIDFPYNYRLQDGFISQI